MSLLLTDFMGGGTGEGEGAFGVGGLLVGGAFVVGTVFVVGSGLIVEAADGGAWWDDGTLVGTAPDGTALVGEKLTKNLL